MGLCFLAKRKKAFRNPKAKERVGYPTQKPVLLLKRIIEIVTDEGDLVIDPFNGSGTTCVAAKLLNRNFIGIDASKDAVDLAEQRLKDMIVTESALLQNGEGDYRVKSEDELVLLESIGAIPVQRNKGIDGFLKEHFEGKPVPIKIQSKYESLSDAKDKLERACFNNRYILKIVIRTKEEKSNDRLFDYLSHIRTIKSPKLLADELTKQNITS